MSGLVIRPATAAEHPAIIAVARDVLGDEHQVHSRRQFGVVDAELFIAVREDETVGFLAWEVDDDWCELLAIACVERRRGIGTVLVAAADRAASARGCRRMRVVTTDANVAAQRFYEGLGFAFAERRVGAVDECRRLYKATIPDDMHDELVYERDCEGGMA